MSDEDPWETRPEENDPTDERDVWLPPSRPASRSTRATSSRSNLPFRRRRGFWFGIVCLVAALVFAPEAWLAGGSKPASATLQPVPAEALQGIEGQVIAAQSSQGVTGQVVGIAGLCLAGSKGGGLNGTPAILSTCTGTEDQQQWTLLANKEVVLDGRCLGVNPKSSRAVSLVGLYTCGKTASEMWKVQDKHTIRSVSSGLCLGSWKNKDTNGSLVGVTECQPSAKAQIWTVPSYAADPSGLAMPLGNIPGWRQVFMDNFNENVPLGKFPAAVSSKWGDYLDGWPDTTHHGTYEPTRVVSIHNGRMNLFLHTVDGIHMVAAPYPRIPGAPGADGGLLYGMYEVRFTAQQVKGYKTAWLLWPDSENQRDGEIDFPEGDLQKNILAFLHHGNSDPKLQDSFATPYTYANWHTATTIWTADAVIFMLDGKVIGESTDKAIIPHKPMHWVLQTETRTGGGPPSDTATANVKIDWVSVWLPHKN
ncbi:ricin-type beta-trefoil lectin domain protein [Trebonia kvetii]|uniref:ricin-type beta-trefoil lectin domain protein n=1 Tax=Trebonia kvetii TaxID=2480626 RepID=UPI0016527571|nr:ricin-type beta-trefoil lectin domain protein [Trebonia kvetii]